MEELSREYYLAHAGLQGDRPSCSRSTRASRHVLGPDALELDARDVPSQRPRAATSGARRALLLDWQVESQSARELAALDEREIAWEGDAVVRTGRRARDPVPARGDRAGQLARPQRARAIDDGARGARGARAGADAARAAPARARHHRVARAGRRLQRDVRAAQRRRRSPRCATSARSSCATRRRCGTRCCPAFAKRVLGMTLGEATRADALALFRAPRVRRVSSRPRDMEPSIRRQVRGDGSRSGRRAARHASTRASARGSARARSARPCACPTRCTSCCARTAGRPTGTTLPARAGARAALREHARRPSVRVPLDGRQLDHRRVRDAVRPPDAGQRVAAPLHGVREADARRSICAPPGSRSCTSCVATARS